MTAPDDMNAVKAASGARPSDASAQSAVPPLPADALIVLGGLTEITLTGTAASLVTSDDFVLV